MFLSLPLCFHGIGRMTQYWTRENTAYNLIRRMDDTYIEVWIKYQVDENKSIAELILI